MKTATTIKLWTLWYWLARPFKRKYKANVCGHQTIRTGPTRSFGELYLLGMPLAENGNPDYCLACAGEFAVRCGWCGRTIHVGAYVTLYLRPTGRTMPEWTRYHRDEPEDRECVVGCESIDCADTGGDYSGRWIPPGRVARFASVFERLTMKVAAGKEHPIAIRQFLSNH